MSDPNYSHEFMSNRRGTCQMIVSHKHCGLKIDAPVHQRGNAEVNVRIVPSNQMNKIEALEQLIDARIKLALLDHNIGIGDRMFQTQRVEEARGVLEEREYD